MAIGPTKSQKQYAKLFNLFEKYNQMREQFNDQWNNASPEHKDRLLKWISEHKIPF